MPTRPYRPRELEWRVFLGSEALRRGLLTPNQLRSSAWVRVRYDVFADARRPLDHELACRAALLRLPPGTVLSGPSAAFLHGVEHAARYGDPVHVTVPRRIGVRRGIRVHVATLGEGDVRTNGLPMTTPGRTAWDLAVWLDIPNAVAAIDTLLHKSLTTPDELATRLKNHAHDRGGRKAHHAISLADGRAQSPPESRLRVGLVLAGLPPPVPQHPIRLPSGLTLHPDLAWPEYKVAVEYDGHWHGAPAHLSLDRRRLNELQAAGWLVLHVTSDRLYRDFPALARQIKDALTSRGWKR